jgi:PhnB protein
MTVRLDPYLAFNGNCAEAMRFYERAIGGKLDVMSFGSSPMCNDFPADSHHLVMHACLSNDQVRLMASDTPPGMPFNGASGSVSLAISYDDNAEAERVFNALAEGGQVSMPFEPAFWAERFGAVTDRFGTSWLVNGKDIPLQF